jgi:hypothetical protein
MKAFPKLQEFVDATNLFLKYGVTGKTIFASDVRNDILEGLDGTNDQSYFDGIKQLLNTLDYSNLQIELIGKEYPKGHRKGAEFEKSRSLTSFYNNSIAVRNEIYNIMKLGGLKNNYPKNGFLCPYELEDVHEEDEARKQDKPEQKEESANNCILDRSNAMDRVNECIDDKTTPLNVGKDTYLKIYDCLLKYHVLDEKEDCKTFAYNLKHGDLSAEYKDDVKIYLRKLCAMILPNIKETDERKKWKHKIAVSFKLKNDDYITKYNTGVNANFVRDLEKIL